MVRAESTTYVHTGVSRARKPADEPRRGSNAIARDHVTRRFGAQLAVLVGLDQSVSTLCDFVQGLDVSKQGEGRTHPAGEGRGKDQGPRLSGKTKYVWQLLSQFLSGGAPSGLIPVPTLPEIDFSVYRQGVEEMVGAITGDEVLGVCFRDAGNCLSPASLEATTAGMDWSLSTLGLCERSQTVVEMCGRGSGRVRPALDMERVVHGTGAGGGRGIFKRLGLSLYDMEDIIAVLSDWEMHGRGFAGGDGVTVGTFDGGSGVTIGAVENDALGIQTDVKGDDGDGDEIGDRVMMIREAYPEAYPGAQGRSRSHSRSTRKRQLDDGGVAGLLTSSSDFGEEATWEHVYYNICTPWVYVMERAVSTSSSLIEWSALPDVSVSALAQVDFALVDEAAFRRFDEQMRGVPDHVVPLLEECATLCRYILHQAQDGRIPVTLDKLNELQPLLDETAFQTGSYENPCVDAARKTILGYRALSPGKSQLIMISKARWQPMYEVLHAAGMSVLQLSLPQHASFFDPKEHKMGSESSADADGIWNDFDCIFLSTDADTMREAMHGSIFGFFKRIVLVETDPTCSRVLEPLLRSLYNRGVSVCLMRVGLGLVGSGAFRLEVPEGAPDGSEERHVYEHLDSSHRRENPDMAFGVPARGHGTDHGGPSQQQDHMGGRPIRPYSMQPAMAGEEERRDHHQTSPNNPRNIQAKTSLGDTSFVKTSGHAMAPPWTSGQVPAATVPGRQPPLSPFDHPLHYQASNDQYPGVAQLADNLFCDREESPMGVALHDSFLERNSAREHFDVHPREHLVQPCWKTFDRGQSREFDASPFLQASNPRGVSPAQGAFQQVHAPSQMPMHSHHMPHQESLFDHENIRPLEAVEHLPLDQMVGAGAVPVHGYSAQPYPTHRPMMEPTYYETKFDHMFDAGERSPFSPLDVAHDRGVEDPPMDCGTPVSFMGGYGFVDRTPMPYPYSQPRPSSRHRDTWGAAYPPMHVPGQQQSPYPAPRLISPAHLATPPPRFWPQPMNTAHAFNNIEKMYDEMRAGRPKRRPHRRGERFKRFN